MELYMPPLQGFSMLYDKEGVPSTPHTLLGDFNSEGSVASVKEHNDRCQMASANSYVCVARSWSLSFSHLCFLICAVFPAGF